MVKATTKQEAKDNKDKTPEEVTQEAQAEAFDQERELLVLERSSERPIDAVAYPPPGTSTWVVVPDSDDFWGPGAKADDHKGHAVQVVQVHTYPNAPAVVTFRCDCSYEWRVTWDGDAAQAIYEATENARKAHEEAREREIEERRDRAVEAAGQGR